METALEIKNVSKMFYKEEKSNGSRRRKRVRTAVVDGVSMEVPKCATYGILGPNGSGKSTLIRMIATLLYPDAGNIEVFGTDVVRRPDVIQRMINRVSVDAAFFKKLSARENLLYTGRLYGISAREVTERAEEILSQLDFEIGRIDSPMEHLSRGMQQKVAIARGMLTSPILLLLDEPTTGLDPASKRNVEKFIRNLREKHEVTILLTTHDMKEAENLCEKIAILDKGKVIAFDTAENLKALCTGRDEPPTLEDAFIQLTGKRLDTEE